MTKLTKSEPNSQARSARYTQQITDEFKAVRVQSGHMTPDLLRIFADGEVGALQRVAAGLGAEGGTDAALPLIHSVINDMKAPGRDKRWAGGPGKGNKPVYSISLEHVPYVMLQSVEDSRYEDRTLQDMKYALREVLGAARRANLPEQFDYAALAVWRGELDTRGLCAKSIKRKLLDIKRLGQIFNLDEDCRLTLRNEYKAAQLEAAYEPSQRYADFRACPLSPIDYARAAHRVSEEAFYTTRGRQTVHRLFITAAVLSLLSFIPERVSDILGIIVGRDITRDAHGWSLHYLSRKTGVDRSFDYLPEQLTPYFDDLILLGADPGHQGCDLWNLYRYRVETESPLFARTNLRNAYSVVRIFELVKAETGHGPNAARKAMTDYLVETDAKATDVLDLLGHRRLSTSERHYAVRSDAIRRQRAAEKLDDRRSGLIEKGSFRLASGRLVNLDRISKNLNQLD